MIFLLLKYIFLKALGKAGEKGNESKRAERNSESHLLCLGENHRIRRKHLIQTMNFCYIGQDKEYNFTKQTPQHTHLFAQTHAQKEKGMLKQKRARVLYNSGLVFQVLN